MLAIIEAIENDDDRTLLTEWYKEFYKIMRKKAYDLIGDYHLANDMVNEAFIKIIRNIEKIKELNSSERAFYFVSTIRSVSIDYLRKKNIESKYVNQYKGEGDDAEDQTNEKLILNHIYETKDFFVDMERYLGKLSERDAQLIVYRCLWEMSDREISEALGIKEQSVHTYVRRAKNKLIKIMNGEV